MDILALYHAAWEALCPQQLGESGAAGQVACALETKSGKVFTGVCIDLPCSLGFCAEQAAVAEMLKSGETGIRKIIAVGEGGNILPPCGRCREFLYQLNETNLKATIVLPGLKETTLEKLLPERWNEPSV